MAERVVDEDKEAVKWGILVEETEDQMGEEEEHLDQPDLTYWHVIGAGFMAIWRVTVPNPKASREEVAKIALPEECLLDPGKKAHKEDEVEVGLFDSEVSTSCMTRLGMNTRWTM